MVGVKWCAAITAANGGCSNGSARAAGVSKRLSPARMRWVTAGWVVGQGVWVNDQMGMRCYGVMTAMGDAVGRQQRRVRVRGGYVRYGLQDGAVRAVRDGLWVVSMSCDGMGDGDSATMCKCSAPAQQLHGGICLCMLCMVMQQRRQMGGNGNGATAAAALGE